MLGVQTRTETAVGLDERANTEVGRLLNGTNNPQQAAIGHLATGAGRAAESLVYLADLDDSRFGAIWPNDRYGNDVVDDAHVRWAAATALTSLDLCIAAAGRLAGFAQRPPRGEDSIRDYYRFTNTGMLVDNRQLVTAPWRAWIDALVADCRYDMLLGVRNTLVHSDALRIIHATTEPIHGHDLRYGYRVGPLNLPFHSSTHTTVMAREVVELSRDVSLSHVAAFVTVLESLPR